MPTELESQITAVTVYRNRARIARTGSIDLPEGESTLVLAGLPRAIDSDSVRISGKGGGITIRGVDVKPDVQEKGQSNKDLEDELEDLRRQEKAYLHDRDTLAEKLAYFKALQPGKKSGYALLNEETSFERVTAIANYLEEQLQITYERLRDVDDALDEIREAIQALEIKLSSREPNEVRAGRAVHIAVEADTEMTFAFVIEYVVTDAWWKPLYDIRLLDDNSVELTYMAQISQKTGENWNEVAIALSTARPALQSTLPELNAWYINDNPYGNRLSELSDDFGMAEFQEMPMLAKRARPSIADAAAGAAAAAAGVAVGAVGAAVDAIRPQEQQAQISQASVTSSGSGAVVTYKVGTPVTIPGSGEPHKTTVTTTDLKAELDYVAAPRLAPEAYLRATITNDSEYTILPGEASIFHGNDFVGKTSLKTIAPEDEFKVQLGVDDRIKLERELVNRETGTRRIGTRGETSFEYDTKITNLLPKPVKIVVQDQYPVSRSNGLKVKLDSVRPEPSEESDLHILTWELEMKPQESKTIHLAFTIEHGRSTRINGLDD